MTAPPEDSKKGRSLDAYASDLFVEFGPDNPMTQTWIRDTRSFQQMIQVVGHERHTESTLLSLVWATLVRTRWFASVLSRLGLNNRDLNNLEMVVVGHGEDWKGCYDLLVLVPGNYSDKVKTASVDLNLSSQALQDALKRLQADFGEASGRLRWRRSFATGVGERVTDPMTVLNAAAILEVIHAIPLRIGIVKKPHTVGTALPRPAWALAGNTPAGNKSTAGIVGRWIDGSLGATCCRHGLSHERALSLIGTVVSMTAANGSVVASGIVVSDDVISDSCFIVFDSAVPSHLYVGNGAPMQGICPRQREPVTFEGISSGPTHAVIHSHDVALLSQQPAVQKRVYTSAVTSPGDSGAALINDEGRIVGFCFERTAIGEDPEYSSWIWADSVYQYHKIR